MQTDYLWSQPPGSLQHIVIIAHLNILSNIAIKCYLSATVDFVTKLPCTSSKNMEISRAYAVTEDRV